MNIVVTGGTGFVGRSLVARLTGGGHDVSILSRSTVAPPGATVALWHPEEPAPAEAIDGADAIVHLAGEPVNGRWTQRKRGAILESRANGTRNLLAGIAAASRAPRRLISASAIGYYGDRGEEVLDETSPSGGDFLAEVCRAWEAAAAEGGPLGLSVVRLRTGLVLGRGGGALEPLRRATRLGAGGRLGRGRQWWSWIHLDDLVRAIEHLLVSPAEGPINLVSPDPVRQIDFARTLGSTLGRPTIVPAPAFGLRAVLGGFSTELLSSRRVSGARLRQIGFTPRFDSLEYALADLLDG